MKFFSFEEKSYLGIDLGRGSIKLVELKDEKGKPRLVTYAYAEKGFDFVKSDSRSDMESAAYLLKELLQKSKADTTQVIASLPGFSVFSSVINLPSMPEKDLISAIHWEAKKFIPMPIEEVVLDWKTLKTFEDKREETNLKILLTAAPRNLVKKYLEIFRIAGLELLSLETESFALSRSLVGNDPSTIMICNLGAKVSDAVIVEKGIPVLNRSFNLGGETITNAIASNLNIDYKRAEQFKMDIGLGSSADGVIPKVIEEVLTSVIDEIDYTIDLYHNQSHGKIEKIILTGGSAFLPNLASYFSKVTNLTTIVGNPWSKIVYPLELEPILEELGPRFSVSLGLALRELL